MHQTFTLLAIPLLLIVMGVSSLAFPALSHDMVPTTDVARDTLRRTSDTCADPTLARTVYEAFSGANTVHIMQFRESFVNADSQQGSPTFWTFPSAMFKAWPTQQASTVPLFRLFSQSTTDAVYAIGVDAQTPPLISGFPRANVVAWVYNTAVCDSVPLMGATLASATDYYYTTDPDEHAGLLATGWADAGVIAFVLPVSSS